MARTTTRRMLVKLGMYCDLVICGSSLLAASAIASQPLWETQRLRLQDTFWQLLVITALALAWHFSLVLTGAYRAYRWSGFGTQASHLAIGSMLSSLWTWLWLDLVRHQRAAEPGGAFPEVLAFFLLAFAGMAFTRLLARLCTHALRRRGRNLRNYLIVGSNRRAMALADRLLANENEGCQVLGFIDDRWHFEDAPEAYKQLHLGGSDRLQQILRTLPIDEVLIALPIASTYEWTGRIIELCLLQGIQVRSEGTLFDVGAYPRVWRNSPAGQLIVHHEVCHGDREQLCKRVIDLFVSAVAILITSPLLALIVLAVRLEGPGPVFFNQERLGQNKRRFRIFKIRTMVHNAEALMQQVEHLNQSQGPTFKLARDPRITKVGHFLRKTSLDELPQLFNVFLGNMSLVGPRPLPVRDYDGFSMDWHRRRFSVKPGVTCLWQVSGRSTINFDRWMELDMDYIDRWSLWLDLEILLKTVPAIVRGSGAM